MKALILILSLILFLSINTAPEDEKVQSLPDYSFPAQIYSGYLNVSAVKKFHYLFNLAQEDPQNKPLALWLNGGPGCSSLDGWANEHGPMFLDELGNFHLNDYTWTKEANIIYLESPGDVGFSYIDSNETEDLFIDPNTTASDNLKALLDFFEKFPEWRSNDFYVTGESYGGIYVPILAYHILEYNKGAEESKKIKLRGIQVGNGVGDWKFDHKAATMDYVFTHHLISYETRLEYNEHCLIEKTFNQEKCDAIKKEISDFLDGINIYDYLRECKVPKKLKGVHDKHSKYYQYAPWAFDWKVETEEGKINLEDTNESNDDDGSQVTPCFDDSNIEGYFNRKDVQQALHVTPKRTWYVCSSAVYDRFQHGKEGSVWAYPILIEAGLKILLYSGDTDVIVPYSGNQLWIKNLGLEIEEPWRQWRAFDEKDFVSGYVVKYKGLTFCTIRGTGHMAPMWKRKEAFYVFSKFLKGEDL